MNRRMILRILSYVLLIEAVAMLPPLILSLVFKEFAAAQAFLITIALCFGFCGVLMLFSPRRSSD